MSNIATHFNEMMSTEEQERIGATADKPEHMRVLRTLDHYDKMREALAEIADQITTEEMHPSAHVEADFEGTYDTIIRQARAALGRSNNADERRDPN